MVFTDFQFLEHKICINKGDVLLEFSSVKWVLNEDHTLYWNVLGTLLLQNFVLVNSYFYEFFVEQTSVVI